MTLYSSVKLKNIVVDSQSGFASGERTNDGVVQLRMNNVTTKGALDWSSFIRVPTTEKQLQKFQLNPGDILFNSTNSPELVGKTTIFENFKEPVVFSNHFVRLRVDDTKVVSKFLARWFGYKWQKGLFKRLCTRWVNQAAVRKEDLLALELPLPPLPEQERIAAILDKADRLRRLRRYALQLGDSYLQSVFLEMFGDPFTNPMGWEKVKLDTLCTQIRDGTHHTPKYVPAGIPFITVRNIVSGKLDFSNTKFITREEHNLLIKRVNPEVGDILVSKDGTIGVPCLIDDDRDFSIFVSVALLKPKTELIHPLFLTTQFRTDGVQRQIRENSKGIAIRHLHLVDFKRLQILLPPPTKQQEFVKIVQRYERLRSQQRESLRQAEHLFESLLDQAFKGGG